VADYKGKIITFGFGASNDLFATDIVCGPSGTEFSLNDSRHRFFIPMLGRHSACNALAAIAVAKRLGVSEEEMIAGLHDSDGPEMRLQLQSAGPVLLLNDAYNANPNSMRAAIETTAGLESKGRRIAVLGDMRELGRSSERYHREIGQIAANTGKFDLLFCVGPQSKFVAEAAKQTGYPANQIIWIQDSATASNKIPALLQKDDLVLLKASRGIRLEAVASAIFDRYTARTVMAARVAS
jgi:UDP-N-acetylmuramyl pentapeptide synthase